MDKVLGSFRYVFACAYQDDVIIYSRTVEEHKKHIDLVLTALQNANLSIKLTKSKFLLDSVEYLGFIVSSQGVSANPEKVKPIIQYQTPTNLTELERFLGMTGVYQRFISQYQVKTEPLRRLKKKDVEFVWGQEQINPFEQLKKDLCLLPTLKQPDFSKPFELHTDAASSAGITVILCQRVDNTVYPLAFASRALTIHEQRYSVREQECLAIIFGIKRFPYNGSSMQKMMYRLGVFHVADALSRHSVANVQAIHETITSHQFDWSKVQQEDSDIMDIINNLVQHKSFTMIENVLYKASNHSKDLCIVVPTSQVSSVIKQFHSSKLGGHFGFKKTKSKISQQRLWWSSMSQDVKEFFQSTTQYEVVKVFFNKYILRHGLPMEILTDGGPPFQSYFFASLVTTLDSHGLSSPAYHAQSNGIVERFMATLRRMILTYTEQECIKESWDQHLRLIQFVYNNTTHESTSFTPFYLVHGRFARYPLVKTNTMQDYDDDKLVPERKFANELQQRLNTAFDVVNNHFVSKEYNNQENPYQVGDQVLLFNTTLTSVKKPRKLQFDWSGPFQVIAVNSKSTVSLKQPGTNKRIHNVHVSRLKKYQEPN
ncbi:hypothetical protein [Parasitella parasitica]|uniref:Integrase catalytic domain-containing protein n=1 Tax=Parasitella parasitica TaxID=35722 RepID=A0A0B7NIE1_9FUNG|nr:hypothetical protein [Parasitella parasitica]